MAHYTQRIRRAVKAAAFTALFCLPFALQAQAQAQDAAYPTRPIKLILPFTAGGATDVAARIVAEALPAKLGQAVTVENRTGAGTVVGTEAAARSAPDGYTLLFTTLSHAINATLHKKLPYDTMNDFEFITRVGQVTFILMAQSKLGVSDFASFMKMMKENPGKLQFASAGNGTPMHLGLELLKTLTKTDAQHIPYRGESAALNDLISGQVSYMLCSVTTCAQRVGDSAMRPLVLTAAQRSSLAPSVPAAPEVGVPDFLTYSWFVILAPKGTPAAIVSKINAAVNSVLAEDAVQERLSKLGVDIERGSTPESTRAFVQKELERWAPVVKATGASVN